MRMLAATIAVLFAGVVQAAALAAQTAPAHPPLSLDFSDFVPYEYAFAAAESAGTRRQTLSYRIVEREGRRVLERRSVEELVEPAAIPRTVWRRTVHTGSTLPGVRPLFTRIVTHQWVDSLAAWSTERVEVEFSGDSIRRVAGTGAASVRPLPADVRQAEVFAALFAHSAGPSPPPTLRIRVYDALTNTVRETGWVVRGQDTITALGRRHPVWVVALAGDTSTIGYYRVDRPRISLGSRAVAKDGSGAERRLIRLWCGVPARGWSCDSSRAGAGEQEE